MSKKTYFKVNGTGSEALPITGGADEFEALNLDEKYERSYFGIVFYTDSSLTTTATPTTGDVVFRAVDGDLSLSIQGGTFPAAQVDDVLQPAIEGQIDGATVTLTGVDAGLYARAWVSQMETSL